jgi:ribosomal protein S12 methylthiotransferase accessory factor
MACAYHHLCIQYKSFYYPAMLVTLDWASSPDSIGIFAMSSNGLASGLSKIDAILSGLYEVIERDAISCWQYFHAKHQFPYSSIIESTIPFLSTKLLIKRIKESSLDLVIIPLFSDFKIPIYQCLLLNSADAANAISIGYGCHHSDEIAINRAITEAAQGRAVAISGSRDDMIYHSLSLSDSFDIDNFKSKYLPEVFQSTPCLHAKASDLLQDILFKVKQLELHEPLFFPFTNTEPFSVVRIIMPSLAPYLGKGSQYSLYSKHPRVTSFQPKASGINALFL